MPVHRYDPGEDVTPRDTPIHRSSRRLITLSLPPSDQQRLSIDIVIGTDVPTSLYGLETPFLGGRGGAATLPPTGQICRVSLRYYIGTYVPTSPGGLET